MTFAPPISKAGGTDLDKYVEKDLAFLWEVTPFEFILVTVLLAGGAAWMTGRANARTWSPDWQLAIYIVLLAAATRFIHFALFDGSLLSLWYYCVDLIVLLVIAFCANRFTRAGQMASQYGFAFERKSPFTFRRRT